MKNALIFLSILAVILGVFAFLAVFGGSSGTYAIVPTPTDNSTTTPFSLPSSTTSSSLSLASSTGGSGLSGSGSSSSTNFYGSAFATPALSWPDGGATFSITAAALQGNQLSFTLGVKMGNSPSCVPLNVRLVSDEAGDLQGPDTLGFAFPDSGNCNGAPGETYNNQAVTFTVNPANLPFLFTTGGSANIFFEVTTTTANGLQIVLPGTSG